MISGIWMKCPHWNVFFLIIKKSRQNMANVSEHGRQLEQEESGCWWNRTSVACKTSLSVCVCVHMYFLSLQPPREKLSTGFTRRKAAITTEQFFSKYIFCLYRTVIVGKHSKTKRTNAADSLASCFLSQSPAHDKQQRFPSTVPTSVLQLLNI